MEELKFPKKHKKNVKFGSQVFSVTPFISVSQKQWILEKLYLDYQILLEENQGNYIMITELGAKLDILLAICVTELGVVDFDKYDYETLLLSGFFDVLKNSVVNYEDVRASMYAMINLLHIEKSLPNFNVGGLFEDMEDTPENKEIVSKMTEVIKSKIGELDTHDQL